MNKKDLSERDICTRYITTALIAAGWSHDHFREEVNLTDGRVIVRGKLAARIKNPEVKGGPKRADYVLYAKGNIPLAVIEAKRNIYPIGHGMQQALNDEAKELRGAVKSEKKPAAAKKLEDRLEVLTDKINKLRQDAKDEQAAGDRQYWPIYNIDIKNPNAPAEESHDQDALLKKYIKLTEDIEKTQNRLRDELAKALAHHFKERDA